MKKITLETFQGMVEYALQCLNAGNPLALRGVMQMTWPPAAAGDDGACFAAAQYAIEEAIQSSADPAALMAALTREMDKDDMWAWIRHSATCLLIQTGVSKIKAGYPPRAVEVAVAQWVRARPEEFQPNPIGALTMGIWELAGVITEDAAERARPDRNPKPLTIHETITGEWTREDLHFDYWSMDSGTREKQRKCAECGKEGLEWGWICLDNRKLYCADCVEPVQLTMQRKAEQYRAKHRKR